MTENQIKEKIHFAHANGFPSKTYSKIFSFLEKDFEIGFLERHAHNPKFPVTYGWDFLKEELRLEIENRYTEPIIGIGHSFGGILHLLAAAENPALYKQIVLLDAPIISRLSSFGLKILNRFNLSDKFAHARLTKFRRNLWKNKTEAFEHFYKKDKFRGFDEEVLRDYIEYGTVENEKGIELFFKPKIEAEIYKTLPDFLPKLRGKINLPVSYIGGTNSTEAKWARIGFMRRKFSFDFYFVEGTHLFPFEKPAETARILLKILQ